MLERKGELVSLRGSSWSCGLNLLVDRKRVPSSDESAKRDEMGK